MENTNNLYANSIFRFIRLGKALLLPLLISYNIINAQQNIGIGGAPDASAKLDIKSTNSGFLMPRLSSAERSSISAPAEGLQIYNTTTKCLNLWDGTSWIEVCSTGFCKSMGGTATIDNTSVDCGSSVNLSLSDYNGSTIQWQSSYNPNNGFIDIPGATSTTLNSTIVTANTSFRAAVTDGSCAPAYSNVISVTGTGNSCLADYWEPITAFANGTILGIDKGVGFSIGNYGYVGGGGNSFISGSVQSFYRFNPDDNSWTQVADFGHPFNTASVFVLNDLAYVVGGVYDDGPWVASVFKYDPSNNTWTAAADFPGGPILTPITFAVDGFGYAGGGLSPGGVVSDFYKYDPNTDTWSTINSYPVPIYITRAFTVGSYAYVMGGQNSSGGMSSIYKFDPSDESWTYVNDYPLGQTLDNAGFVIGNYIYVGTRDDNGNATTDFYRYDPIGNTWLQRADVPAGRWGAESFSIGSKGYLGGGYQGSQGLNDFYRYNP